MVSLTFLYKYCPTAEYVDQLTSVVVFFSVLFMCIYIEIEYGRAYDWWWGQWNLIELGKSSQYSITSSNLGGWKNNNRGEDTTNLLLLIWSLCIVGSHISQYTPDSSVICFIRIGLISEVESYSQFYSLYSTIKRGGNDPIWTDAYMTK